MKSWKTPSGDDTHKSVGKGRKMDAGKMKQVSFLSKQQLNQKKKKNKKREGHISVNKR